MQGLKPWYHLRRRSLCVTNCVIFGIRQSLYIGIVGFFQGEVFLAGLQNIFILLIFEVIRHRNVFFSLMRFALFCSLSGCSFGDIVFPVTGLDEHGDFRSGADLTRVKRGPEKIAVFFLLRFSFLFESQKCPGAVLPQQKTVARAFFECFFDLRDVA